MFYIHRNSRDCTQFEFGVDKQQHKICANWMLTMRLTTRQWLMPVEGNGQLKRAVRMLQRKVQQLDEEVS